MSDAPLVSVLVRSTDRPTLERALDSAAAQTWPNIELIVVAASGPSHRPLPDNWRGRPLRLVPNPPLARLNRPQAANCAIDHVRGEWFNFLDDDDELMPAHIATLLASPRPANERVLYSRAVVHDLGGHATGHSGFAGFHAQLYFQNRSLIMATMIHRSLIDEGIRFDPAFEIFEDRDFMIACAARTPFRFVDAVTCVWHAHLGDSGLSHAHPDQAALHERYTPLLHAKWKTQFDQWLAEPGAMLFLGQHHLMNGEFDRALPYLEHALRLAPNDVNALNLCGMANLRTGNPARAQQLMERALKLLPTHAGLRANLKLILDARGMS